MEPTSGTVKFLGYTLHKNKVEHITLDGQRRTRITWDDEDTWERIDEDRWERIGGSASVGAHRWERIGEVTAMAAERANPGAPIGIADAATTPAPATSS